MALIAAIMPGPGGRRAATGRRRGEGTRPAPGTNGTGPTRPRGRGGDIRLSAGGWPTPYDGLYCPFLRPPVSATATPTGPGLRGVLGHGPGGTARRTPGSRAAGPGGPTAGARHYNLAIRPLPGPVARPPEMLDFGEKLQSGSAGPARWRRGQVAPWRGRAAAGRLGNEEARRGHEVQRTPGDAPTTGLLIVFPADSRLREFAGGLRPVSNRSDGVQVDHATWDRPITRDLYQAASSHCPGGDVPGPLLRPRRPEPGRPRPNGPVQAAQGAGARPNHRRQQAFTSGGRDRTPTRAPRLDLVVLSTRLLAGRTHLVALRGVETSPSSSTRVATLFGPPNVPAARRARFVRPIGLSRLGTGIPQARGRRPPRVGRPRSNRPGTLATARLPGLINQGPDCCHRRRVAPPRDCGTTAFCPRYTRFAVSRPCRIGDRELLAVRRGAGAAHVSLTVGSCLLAPWPPVQPRCTGPAGGAVPSAGRKWRRFNESTVGRAAQGDARGLDASPVVDGADVGL